MRHELLEALGFNGCACGRHGLTCGTLVARAQHARALQAAEVFSKTNTHRRRQPCKRKVDRLRGQERQALAMVASVLVGAAQRRAACH